MMRVHAYNASPIVLSKCTRWVYTQLMYKKHYFNILRDIIDLQLLYNFNNFFKKIKIKIINYKIFKTQIYKKNKYNN
jgi:hypothetical protein